MNRKKIFIPLLIIFILLTNVLISTVYEGFMSFAVDNDGIEVSVDTSDVNNIKLTLGGNLEGNIISIKYTNVYMSLEAAKDYFDNPSNSFTDITSKNQGVSNNVLAITLDNVEEGKTYTIAIEIDIDGQIKTMIKQKEIAILNNANMEITLEQKQESPSNIIINVTSNPNDIVLLKIAKASEISQDSDFKTKGEEISIEPSKKVTGTYELKEEGYYKIYAEDSKGNGTVYNTKYIAIKSTKTIKIVHKKGDSKALVIRAEDSAHKIKVMKVILSDDYAKVEELRNNGTPISITTGTKVEGEYTISGNGTYITVYIEDDCIQEDGYGLYKIVGQTINSIEEDGPLVVPVEPDEDLGNQGTGTEGSGNQGTGTEGSGNQGTGTEGSGNQGSETEGSGNQGTGAEGSGNQGSEAEGSGNQGSGTEDSENQGSETEGSENQGSEAEGSGNQGSEAEGSGNQGTEAESSGNQATGNEGNIVVSMPNDSNNIVTSENGNEIGEINPDDNNTNTKLNIENQSNIETSFTNRQTNIQDSEQINSSNDSPLPKTGVEDTGIILLIITLLGVAIMSFVKFIRIK